MRGTDPLNAEAVQAALAAGSATWMRVELRERTASTNDDVVRAARDGAAEGLVVVAEHQLAGRGRLGRSWHSAPGAALTFSVLLRPSVAASRWSWLPLLAALAVRDGVAGATERPVALKWPNDVLVDDLKLCGVLVERVDAGGPAAVVGIGINVSLTGAELPAPQATSLALAGACDVDRARLLVDVLGRLAAAYESWRDDEEADAELRARYELVCSTLGRAVRVELPGGEHLAATAVRLDPGGRLVVDLDGGERVLSAGDVVHLRAAP